MEYIRAFLLGGLLCALGQILIDRTALTPAKILTGFGHLLARGVRKAVAEQGLLGVLTGGITAAAGGITAAIFFGFLVAAIFKSKPKG